MPRTLAFLHAHPDDEALLTAGTMARATAEGQRVVLITATAGEAGLASNRWRAGGLGGARREELLRSARVLGVAEVVLLDYPDSGLTGRADSADGRTPFANVALDEAAERVAGALREHGVDTLVGYDPSGGYGHPDHIQVHRVGEVAATIADVDRYFEATLPRSPFAAAGRLARFWERLPGAELPEGFDPESYLNAYLPGWQITHRVDVRRYLDAKREAMRAHASQLTGADTRTLSAVLALPRPIFSLLFGTEYYRRVW